MNVCFPELGRVGRLGNALYQLAATAGIASRMGVEPRFNADWLHRPYFSVPDDLFVDDWDHDHCIPAHHTHLAQHIDERCRIYLQDYNLFADILPTLRTWFAPSAKAQAILDAEPQVAEFGLLAGPILSVHVRRGDNAPGGDPGTPDKHLYHPMPSLDYYLEAIRQNPGAASMAVFSDDPDWCVEHIPGADLYFRGVTRPKEHESDYLTAPVLDWIDWQLQTRCHRHVCSNSTFGIMAAIIAADHRANVPWPIYGPRLKHIDASLLFPDTWRAITTTGDRRASRPR